MRFWFRTRVDGRATREHSTICFSQRVLKRLSRRALSGRYDPGTLAADWLGAPMYFSGYTSDESRSFVTATGLSIVSLQSEPIIENGRATEFLWLVARSRASPYLSRAWALLRAHPLVELRSSGRWSDLVGLQLGF